MLALFASIPVKFKRDVRVQGLPIMIQRLGMGDPAIASKHEPEKHVYLQVLRMEFSTQVIFPETSKREGECMDGRLLLLF